MAGKKVPVAHPLDGRIALMEIYLRLALDII